MRFLAILLLLAAPPALAEGEQPGDFDYYVLALSWSPNWCQIEGDARQSTQCDPGADFGWILHGLWPQYEQGWPSFCRSLQRDPSRAQTAQMADIMGTAGLAWYQWKKHGRCSGLSAERYFEASRTAFKAISRPKILRNLTRDVTLPARLIEEAFLRENPGLTPDMATVTCRDGMIQEMRICLTTELEPRRCGADVVRDCTLSNAGFAAIK